MSEWHTGWTEGYASARSEAAAEIAKLREALAAEKALTNACERVNKRNDELLDENRKLRAILFQFAAYDDDYENDDCGAMTVITVPIGVIRAAAAALKETGDE